MNELMAKVYFTKETERDNYSIGVHGDRVLLVEEHLEFKFTNREDLVNRMAEFLGQHFDVNSSDVIEHMYYDDHNKSFFFCQNEDECGDRKNITEKDPDGFASDYRFDVTVYEIKEVNYKF